MAPSRKGKQRAGLQPADNPAPDAEAWNPYAQGPPEEEENWDPNIEWEIEGVVGQEIATDGTK